MPCGEVGRWFKKKVKKRRKKRKKKRKRKIKRDSCVNVAKDVNAKDCI